MNNSISSCLAAVRRAICATASLAIVGFFGACSEAPTASSAGVSSGPALAKKGGGGKPPQCDAFPSLTITLRSDGSDALKDDGDGSYTEGGTVGAHLAGNGNLMFWTSQHGSPADRFVNVTTDAPFSGPTTDRIYTNSHLNPGGNDACGLAGMVDGPGSAVVEVELDSDGIVRYGKACDGNPVDIEGKNERVITSRSGNTWEIEGSVGVHCNSGPKKKGKRTLTKVGEAKGFLMTLVAP